MPKPNYANIDLTIINVVKNNNHRFSSIMSQMRARNFPEIAYSNSDLGRVVDRRLQALRKQNKLRYTPTRGWHIPVQPLTSEQV